MSTPSLVRQVPFRHVIRHPILSPFLSQRGEPSRAFDPSVASAPSDVRVVLVVDMNARLRTWWLATMALVAGEPLVPGALV